MEYFVRSNLKHDGTAYTTGDTIELPENVADSLLESGVVQAEPIEEVKSPENLERVVTSPKKKKAANATQPEVGGEKIETGEPSVDGPAAAVTTEAKDITPKTEETTTTDPSANL